VDLTFRFSFPIGCLRSKASARENSVNDSNGQLALIYFCKPKVGKEYTAGLQSPKYSGDSPAAYRHEAAGPENDA